MLICSTSAFAQNTIYVDKNVVSGSNETGVSWGTAYNTLQEALDAAGSGDEIWVAGGTYVAPGSGFVMKNDVEIYGGFAGGEANLNDRDWQENETLLQGGGGRVVNNNFTEGAPLTSSAVLDGFTLTGGSATSGGGMYNYYASPTLTNVTISGNSADYYGGGMYNSSSSPILTNVSMTGNTATGETVGIGFGGGMYNTDFSSPTLTNVSITNNMAFDGGGGMYNNSGSPQVHNTIIWGNTAPDYPDLQPGAANFYYSVAAGWNLDGEGNLTENDDPQFTDPDNGDYTLQATSPAINAGSNDLYEDAGGDLENDLDLAGNPRLDAVIVDMGAYEFQGATAPVIPDDDNILYVNKNVSDSNETGVSWDNAIPELADALKWAREQHDDGSPGWDSDDPLKIWVAKGTYKPLYHAEDGNYDQNGDRDNAFVLVPNVELYGGFDPDNEITDLSDDRIFPTTNPGEGTILSGDLDGNDNHTSNAYHVVLVPDIVDSGLLDGFTVQGANGNGSNTITSFGSNFTHFEGGGVFNRGTLTVRNGRITQNRVEGSGFPAAGGGVLSRGSLTLRSVVVDENHSSSGGGGLSIDDGSADLINVLVAGNTASQGAGISFAPSTEGILTNTTITENAADFSGGGLYVVGGIPGTTVEAFSSIVWGNTALTGADVLLSDPDFITFTANNSIVGGGAGGGLDEDPLFANPGSGDFTLQATSPAINTGDNDALPEGLTTDLAGNPRLDAVIVDMGAYEFQGATAPVIPDDDNILYVNKNVSGSNKTGDSWANALPELADALKWAKNNYDSAWETTPLKIYVAIGTYKPMYSPADDNFGNGATRDNAFLMVKNVQLYGGFDPDNDITDLSHDRILPATGGGGTILSGDIGNTSNNSDNAYHVLISAGDAGNALVDGLTITKGNANGSGFFNVYGNAVGLNSGGGMINDSSSPTLTNISITGNTANVNGGGMHNDSSSPILTNVSIIDNSAGAEGGGMHNIFSSPTLTNGSISGNTADYGGGMYNDEGTDLTITNSILWGNSASDGNEMYNTYDIRVVTLTLSHTLYANGAGDIYNDTGEGPITVNETASLHGDPQFADPANGDYSLIETSPAINTGDNSAIPTGVTTDLAGNDRIFDGVADPDIVDMGAYEFQGEPETPLTLTVGEGWRMLSNPIAGQSYADMLAPLWTQGVPGSDYEGDANTFPNVYTWNTSYGGDCVSEYDNNEECVGWQVPSSTDFGNAIPAGSGFIIFVFEDDDFDGGITEPEDFDSDKTLTLSGPTHTGPVEPVMNENGDGWTLVGNPYRLPVAFSDLERVDVKNVAYVYDPNATGIDPSGPVNGNGGAWRSIAGDYGEIPSGNIAPGQGFFVQTVETPSGTPALTFSEDDQTGGGDFYGKEKQLRDFVRLEVQGESLYNSAWIRFSSEGALEPTNGEALELQPLSARYAMLGARKADGTLMDIAHFPLDEQDLEIPLAVEATQSGQFTIRATDLDLPAGMTLYLYDRETGQSMPIGEDFEYMFDLEVSDQGKNIPPYKGGTKGGVSQTKSTTPKKGSSSAQANRSTGAVGPAKAITSGTDRFLLTTTPGAPAGELPGEMALEQNYPNPFNPATVISYQLPVNSQVRLEVYDMLGRNVATLVDGQVAAGAHQVNFDASDLSSGVYLYRLQAGSAIFTKKLTLIK